MIKPHEHLVLNKFWHVLRCGMVNAYLVVLLVNYYVNADVGVPLRNWAAINGTVSRGPGLAKRHLVFCSFLMNVQLGIDWFSDVHQLSRIGFFFAKRGRTPAAATPHLWATFRNRHRVLWYL